MTGLTDGDPRHGTTNGYNHYSCRCDRCRKANTADQARYRNAS